MLLPKNRRTASGCKPNLILFGLHCLVWPTMIVSALMRRRAHRRGGKSGIWALPTLIAGQAAAWLCDLA
jgi:hypothetical protein